MSLGVKETKDVVIAVARFGNATGAVLADGKITPSDAMYLFAPMTALAAAYEGIEQVPAELADLDTAELADLQATFVREFSIPEAGAEALVEKAVAAAAKLVELFLSFKPKAA